MMIVCHIVVFSPACLLNLSAIAIHSSICIKIHSVPRLALGEQRLSGRFCLCNFNLAIMQLKENICSTILLFNLLCFALLCELRVTF